MKAEHKSTAFSFLTALVLTIVTAFMVDALFDNLHNVLIWLISLAVGAIVGFLLYRSMVKKTHHIEKELKKAFPEKWRTLLQDHVIFYQKLPAKEQKQFEEDVRLFLASVKISGVETQISDDDKLLVAASAVIPVFRFREWNYQNLDEVLLYPDNFNEKYETASEQKRNILGMVGDGVMDRKMILSLPALRQSFYNPVSPVNVGVHEFSHLIDKSDGATDGIPRLFLDEQYILPWLDVLHKETRKIRQGESDINPYAAVNQQEFFAVVSEYFFKKPELLKGHHPELYEMLCLIFRTKQ